MNIIMNTTINTNISAILSLIFRFIIQKVSAELLIFGHDVLMIMITTVTIVIFFILNQVCVLVIWNFWY